MNQDGYLDSMIFWLKRAYLAARKSLDQSLLEHNLTGSQLELLRHVLQHDGIEQRTLQERIAVSSASITGLVDGLVSRGLVQRVANAADARVKQLFVTQLGRELGEQVNRTARAIEEQMLTGFSPAEQALAKELFARMVRNLGSETEDGC